MVLTLLLLLQLRLLFFEVVPEGFEQSGDLAGTKVGVVLCQEGLNPGGVGLVIHIFLIVRLSVLHFNVVVQTPPMGQFTHCFLEMEHRDTQTIRIAEIKDDKNTIGRCSNLFFLLLLAEQKLPLMLTSSSKMPSASWTSN